MYRSKGHNYLVHVEWGNEAFGHTGTSNMVSVSLNQINKVLFMPEYDSTVFSFPPDLAISEQFMSKKKLSVTQSRVMEFELHDLIFIASENRKDCITTASHLAMQTDEAKRHKLIQFIDPESYRRYIKQLKQTPLLARTTDSSHFHFPSRDDLIHVEVYNYLDTFLQENSQRLPYGFRESLELNPF